jgi:hypothetical protein
MSKQFQAFPLASKRLELDPRPETDYPKVNNAAQLHSAPSPAAQDVLHDGTNFSEWIEEDIRLFLDRRGEDADDCPDFEALVKRAQLCEATTGPAVRPSTIQNRGDEEEIDDEPDPLEAFMAEIDALQASSKDKGPDNEAHPAKKPRKDRHAGGLDLDEDDFVADFLEARQQRQGTRAAAATATPNRIPGVKAPPVEQGYGSDDEVYAAAAAEDAAAEDAAGRRGDLTELPALQHDALNYDDFEKDFYEEVPEIAALDVAAVNERRRTLGIRLSGLPKVPAPINSFEQCGFDKTLLSAIQRAGYAVPTPIQAQALPVVLSGRDVMVSCTEVL